jgi:hypothetical protein
VTKLERELQRSRFLYSQASKPGLQRFIRNAETGIAANAGGKFRQLRGRFAGELTAMTTMPRPYRWQCNEKHQQRQRQHSRPFGRHGHHPAINHRP